MADPLKDRYKVNCDKGLESGSTNKYRSGTGCEFKCNSGFYRQDGSEKIKCLVSAQWDNKRAFCEGSYKTFFNKKKNSDTLCSTIISNLLLNV